MDKDKSAYETVLGFATLIISLSAFKEQLEKIEIEFASWKITAAKLFLWLVIALSICFYLYVVERIASEKYVNSKLWNIYRNILFLFFGGILLAPPTLAIVWCILWVIKMIPNQEVIIDSPKWIWPLLSAAGALNLSFLLKDAFKNYFSHRESIKIYNEVMGEQINALKYLGQSNYMFSVMTSLKALNIAITFLLRQRKVHFSDDFLEKVATAESQKLISSDQQVFIRSCYLGATTSEPKLFLYPDANQMVTMTSELMRLINES